VVVCPAAFKLLIANLYFLAGVPVWFKL